MLSPPFCSYFPIAIQCAPIDLSLLPCPYTENLNPSAVTQASPHTLLVCVSSTPNAVIVTVGALVNGFGNVTVSVCDLAALHTGTPDSILKLLVFIT